MSAAFRTLSELYDIRIVLYNLIAAWWRASNSLDKPCYVMRIKDMLSSFFTVKLELPQIAYSGWSK